MSFSKSKRFVQAEACAPPPGAYDPKQVENQGGPNFSVDTIDRFKSSKENIPGPGAFDLSTCSIGNGCAITPRATPQKKLFVEPSAVSGAKKKLPGKSAPELQKIRELEKQIKKLLAERVEQDKILNSRDEELKTLDGKLKLALKEKSSLEASIAQHRKEIQQLAKSKDLLKNKVEAVDTNQNKKEGRLQEDLKQLQGELYNKDREICDVRDKMDYTVKVMQADLEASNSNVRALEERNKALEESYQQVVKDNEGLEDETTKMYAISGELRMQLQQAHQENETLNSKVEHIIDSTNEKIKNISQEFEKISEKKDWYEQALHTMQENLTDSTNCQNALRDYRDAMSVQLDDLEDTVKMLKEEKFDDEETIRHLKGELFAVSDLLKQREEEMEELLKHEQVLNENIVNLSNKCQVFESNLNVAEQELKQQEKTLKSEIEAIKQSHIETKQERSELQSSNVELLKMLEIEKAEIEDLHANVKKLEANVEQLTSEVDQQKETLSEMETVKANLLEAEDTILNLTFENSKLKTEIDELMTEQENNIDLDEADVRVTQEELETVKTECQSMKETLIQYEAQLEDLETAKSESESSNKNLDALVEKLTLELDEEHEKFVSLMMEKLKIDNEEENLRKNLSQSNQRIEELEKENRDLDSQVERLTIEHEQDTSRFGHLEDENSEELHNLKAELESKSIEFEQLEARLKSEIAEFKTDIERHESRVTTLSEELEKKTKSEEKAGEELITLKAKYEELKIESSSKLKTMEEKISSCRQETVEANKRSMDISEELNQQLQQQETSFNKVKEDYSKRLVESQLKLSQAEVQYEGYKQRSEQALADKSKTCEQLQEQITTEKSNMEDKIKHMEDTMTTQQKMAESRESELKTNLCKIQEQTEVIQVKYDTKLKEIETLKEGNMEIVAKLKEQIKNNEKELSSLNEQKALLTAEKDTLSKSNDEKLENMTKNQIQMEQKYKTKLSEIQNELKNQKTDHEQITKELHAKYGAKLTKIVQDKTKEIEELQKLSEDQIVQMETVTQTVEQKLLATTTELQTTRFTCENKVKDSEKKVQELQMKVTYYEDQIRQLLDEQNQGLSEDEREQLLEEVEKWKNFYEQLQEKVAPFQEQLDSFEAERLSLLGQSQNAQKEISKLSSDYARILGHQNQKQKIHHVLKIKEENNNLKHEMQKLRDNETKLKRQIRNMEAEKTSANNQPRLKFDPSKAFRHSGKENDTPSSPRAPLKDGNRVK
ncbi:unnamed protein product [Owenia fusiformis]|uniref:Hyaluronan-mediated motility receptor C-terminal domain-containing protein n=1 Tax=Owenia fusiformis TaxID=6347 RepID=A0A8S4N7E3_OWEFU|nr:unnamed protein product [Owenia fusiformis]